MNQSGFIEQYIDSRLAELDQQKDLATIWQKERFSFGMDSKKFSHLPAWKNLVAKKEATDQPDLAERFCSFLNGYCHFHRNLE
jgi:glycine cleavage system regulatory protein